MKLMLRKSCLLFVCLVVWGTSFSQKLIIVKGADSISIQIKTDTAVKSIYVYRVNLKDGTADTDTFQLTKPKVAALKDSAGFYRAFRGYIKTDSLKRILADTVKTYLLSNRDFKIIITDTTASAASIPVKVPPVIDQSVDKSWLEILIETTPLLIAFILLITVITCLVLLLLKKKTGRQSVRIELPEELVRTFNGIKKDKDIGVTVRKIRQAHETLVEELDIEKRKSGHLKNQVKELEELRDQIKNQLREVNQALQAKQEEIIAIEEGNESFTAWAEQTLDKYYSDLAMVLEQNQIKDEQEIYRLILTRLITFSMHSASILKKQIRDATELDSLNIQLLNGEQPRPKGVITENTQFGHADPLAYYIYHLLKKHQVEGLQDVFVQGYKIGN